MAPHDRFLRTRPRLQERAALGRVFSVFRETWPTSADPKKMRPEQAQLASRRTASDAADLARQAAMAYDQHGFHKPSGAWWGSDGLEFHRFVVAARRPGRRGGLLLGVGLAAVAATAVGAVLHRSAKR